VTVVGALDAAQLVSKTALRDFAPPAQRSKVRSCRPTQVVQSEVRQFVRDAIQGDVQRIDAHMRHPLAGVASALRNNELAAGGETAQRAKPFDHGGCKGNVETLAGLGA